MEQCTDVDALMKLNEQMAIEFTLRVAEAKKDAKKTTIHQLFLASLIISIMVKIKTLTFKINWHL